MRDKAKINLITSIIRYRIEEEEVGHGGEFTEENMRENISSLDEKNIEQLESIWKGSVGEWVALRPDMNPPEDTDWDAYINDLLEKVKNGESPIGYITWVKPETIESYL